MSIADIKNTALRRTVIVIVAIPALVMYGVYGAYEFSRDYFVPDIRDAWNGSLDNSENSDVTS